MSDYCTLHKQHDCDCVVVGNEVTELRAEVRDLKARLKAASKLPKAMDGHSSAKAIGAFADELDEAIRATDLRVKSWRKP